MYLHYSDEVTHLRHILASDLNDKSDIIRAVKDLNCKPNSLFCIFHAVDSFFKCFLLSLTVQWNLRIKEKFVHRLVSDIRRLSFIGEFFAKIPSFYIFMCCISYY